MSRKWFAHARKVGATSPREVVAFETKRQRNEFVRGRHIACEARFRFTRREAWYMSTAFDDVEGNCYLTDDTAAYAWIDVKSGCGELPDGACRRPVKLRP